MLTKLQTLRRNISEEQWFMGSVLLVNAGNYLYNLILGRLLKPEQFADAAILITFLLVLSFIAMTFQLVTAKFSVLFQDNTFKYFISKVNIYALYVGVALALGIVIGATSLQNILNTSSRSMFVIFGIGVPFYFFMSINRGFYQGKKAFKKLSITYQLEMISRLLITLGLLFIFNIDPSVIIALGILLSLGFGLMPFNTKMISFKISKGFSMDASKKKLIRNFFILTAFYELTQIIINNSDILLVKHYFDAYKAGLYASLALIGRVVYFIAWMFVMLLLPKVIELKKEGKPTKHILITYVMYILVIASIIILACVLCPKLVILVLFGEQYISMAPLLWKYALATSLFAVSNIFAYFYLSLDQYIPVIISGIFGMLQIGLIVFFHKNLEEVVHMQIITMILLLVIQLIFFKLHSEKNINPKTN